MNRPVTEREALTRVSGWSRTQLLAGTVAAAVVAVAATVLVGSDVGWVDRLDRWLNREWVAAAVAHPLGADLALVVTFWGNTPVVIVVTAVTVGWQWFRGRPVLATWVAATLVGGWSLNHALKAVVDRARPPSDGLFIDALGTSFPSGHAQVAGYGWVTFGLLALIVVRGRHRWWLAACCWGLGLLVVGSRVVLGVHWPSDVIAGYAVGVAGALLAAWLLVQVARRRRQSMTVGVKNR